MSTKLVGNYVIDRQLPAGSFKDHPVWAAILSYEIGPADAAMSFAARLARENRWSDAQSHRVILEYKKFAFLAATGDRPITPSDAVDQVWHLHLTYTRDYWDRFCPQVLGRPLHHGPTEGGAAEQHKFFAYYADTLARYEAVFGMAPPRDLWPDAATRLREDPKAVRVHPRDAWIVPKRLKLLIFAALVVLAAIVFTSVSVRIFFT